MSTAPAAASTGQTAAPSAPPTELKDLPIELLQEIAKHTGSDILSLRAVCRNVRDKADDVFVKKYFSTRVHLTTRHSLDVLAKIAKVPRLRQALKEIEFEVVLLWRIVPVQPEEHRGFCEDGGGFEGYLDSRSDDDHLLGANSPVRLSEGVATASEVARVVRSRWPTQRLTSRVVMADLADIFTDLAAQSRIIPSISINLPKNGRSFQGFGTRWLVRNMFPTSHGYAPNDAFIFTHRTAQCGANEHHNLIPEQKKVTAAILEAISATNLGLNSLELKGGREYAKTYFTARGALYHSPGATQVFSNLKVLTADFSIAIIVDLNGILSACQQLEDIRMTLVGELRMDGMMLRNVATALAGNSTLKNITVSQAHWESATDLIGFLRQHEVALRKVYLSRVFILARDEWQALFADLSTFPKLEELGVSIAMGGRKYWTTKGFKKYQKMGGKALAGKVMCNRQDESTVAEYQVRGRDAVKHELQELASTAPAFERCWEKEAADGSAELVLVPDELID